MSLVSTALQVPHGSDGKESACQAKDLGLISGSGRSLGEGNGNPLQYCCLENSMDRGAWQATVRGIANWFSCQLTLPSWDKSHLIMEHNPFYMLLIFC